MINSILSESDTELKMLTHIANKGFVLAIGVSAMSRPEYLHSTFEKSWRDYYEKKLLYAGDPVVIWALHNIGSIRWSEINFIDIRGVFKKALAFEMNYGAVVSLKMKDKPSLLTVCRSDREFTVEEIEIVSNILDKLTIDRVPNWGLSDGELTILKLLSYGNTFKEISVVEKISESGAKRRASSAQSKLGAKNTVQAVFKAGNLGLIDV